ARDRRAKRRPVVPGARRCAGRLGYWNSCGDFNRVRVYAPGDRFGFWITGERLTPPRPSPWLRQREGEVHAFDQFAEVRFHPLPLAKQGEEVHALDQLADIRFHPLPLAKPRGGLGRGASPANTQPKEALKFTSAATWSAA